MPTFLELQPPGYLHVLLNHLPVTGLAMGILALALKHHSRKCSLSFHTH
jgi:hypothetical protein